MGMPPFEFFNTSQDLDVKKAYLRDLDATWYHGGVQGVADDVPGVAERLRNVLEDVPVNKVVFAGNSAGGWAALLFGALVGVDLVLAFSPQTTLRQDELHKVNDKRWDRRLQRARRRKLLNEDLLDLRPILEAHPPEKESRRVIHYPSTYGLDAFHAERLDGLPGVELNGHGGDKVHHGLIRSLRDSGTLGTILRDAVAERQASD
jgi:hypothetical protein